jgi:glycosyltransferase involved in cell wall biosynthesis
MINQNGKLRVLISGHLPPPIGGMATYYQTLINSTLSEYVQFQFVQTSSQKRELSGSGRATFSNLIAAFRDCARFTQALVNFHPTIVHIGTAFGLSFLKHSYCVLVARILGKRVLLHPHCSLSVLYQERSKIWRWFFRNVIRLTDGIIVLSQEWLQLNSIVPGSKVFYLPNSIDSGLYKSAREYHLGSNQRHGPSSILYLGYLGKAKGTFELIDAAQITHTRDPYMVFELVGSELTPGELSLLEEKVNTLGLQGTVKLNGPADSIEKIEYFRNADIFVYPSYHEGTPMAILEAMASGLPIVASRVGGIPDVVSDQVNGILVEPRNPEQLADAICRLNNDQILLSTMQKNSYQIVLENFSIDQHVIKLVKIYEFVVRNFHTVEELT